MPRTPLPNKPGPINPHNDKPVKGPQVSRGPPQHRVPPSVARAALPSHQGPSKVVRNSSHRGLKLAARVPNQLASLSRGLNSQDKASQPGSPPRVGHSRPRTPLNQPRNRRAVPALLPLSNHGLLHRAREVQEVHDLPCSRNPHLHRNQVLITRLWVERRRLSKMFFVLCHICTFNWLDVKVFMIHKHLDMFFHLLMMFHHPRKWLHQIDGGHSPLLHCKILKSHDKLMVLIDSDWVN